MKLQNPKTWYRALPRERKKALWFMVIGFVFFVIGLLGLAGIIPSPRFAR